MQKKRPPDGKTLTKMSFKNSRAFQKPCPERLESICMSCFGYFGHLLTWFGGSNPFFFTRQHSLRGLLCQKETTSVGVLRQFGGGISCSMGPSSEGVKVLLKDHRGLRMDQEAKESLQTWLLFFSVHLPTPSTSAYCESGNVPTFLQIFSQLIRLTIMTSIVPLSLIQGSIYIYWALHRWAKEFMKKLRHLSAVP